MFLGNFGWSEPSRPSQLRRWARKPKKIQRGIYCKLPRIWRRDRLSTMIVLEKHQSFGWISIFEFDQIQWEVFWHFGRFHLSERNTKLQTWWSEPNLVKWTYFSQKKLHPNACMDGSFLVFILFFWAHHGHATCEKPLGWSREKGIPLPKCPDY